MNIERLRISRQRDCVLARMGTKDLILSIFVLVLVMLHCFGALVSSSEKLCLCSAAIPSYHFLKHIKLLK